MAEKGINTKTATKMIFEAKESLFLIAVKIAIITIIK